MALTQIKTTGLADSAVTTAKINDDAVTDAKVADAITVTGAQTGITAVGTLDAGSITSGFGNIDNGSSTITTTGTVSTGALTVGGQVRADRSSNQFALHDASGTALASLQAEVSGVTGGALIFKPKNTGGSFTERVRIDEDGNVGVGVNPDELLHIQASSNPKFQLEDERVNVGLDEVIGTIQWKGNDSSSGGASLKAKIEAVSNASSGDVYDLVFHTGLYAGNEDSETMRIDKDGKCGINEPSPNTKLHVNSGTSNISATFESTDTGSYINIIDNTSGTFGGLIGVVGDDIVLSPNNVERMRIDSSGGINLSSNSLGISFNGDTTSGTSRYLDDYEEGTWSPTLQNGTFNWVTQVGWYTKIGRMVTLNIQLKWNSKSGSGDVSFSNFPFTAINSSSYRATGSLGYISGLDYPSGVIDAFVSMSGNTTNAQIWMAKDNSAPVKTDVTNMDTSGELQLTITYITD